jgi:hypothetical protein
VGMVAMKGKLVPQINMFDFAFASAITIETRTGALSNI